MKRKHLLLASTVGMLMSFSLISCDDDDEVKVPVETVTEVAFSDENTDESKVSGILSWTAPASVTNITKYVIYTSADGKTKGTKIMEVPATETSCKIENLDNPGYLLVVAANEFGESAVCAAVKVQDGRTVLEHFYFLSSGKMGNNNSSLYMYDVKTKKMTPDYFAAQNGRGLGDTAQDMLVYGSKMYIAVYGESTIEVTDLEAKSIKQIKTEGAPRALTSKDGKVYVSYYNGYVARLDTASLQVDATAKVGRNPEQLAISGDKLYVANSGGMDYNTPAGYDKTVSVVDLASFKEEKKIDVVINPCNMTVDNQGDIYLVSMGNYGDVPNTLQRIDAKTGTASVITETNATELASDGDNLYMFYSQYDANWNQVISYIAYDAINEKVLRDNFITDGTTIDKVYKMGVVKDFVYFSTSDYVNDGDVYFYSKDGKLVDKFEAGLNPMRVVYAQAVDFK